MEKSEELEYKITTEGNDPEGFDDWAFFDVRNKELFVPTKEDIDKVLKGVGK